MADSTPTFEFDRDKHIALNGKVYDRTTFDEETARLVSTINFADQEIMTQQTNLEIYRYGRDRMVKTMLEMIDGKGYEALADIPEPEESPEQ